MSTFVSNTVVSKTTLRTMVFPFIVRTITCFPEVLPAVVKASTLFPPQASVVEDAEWPHEVSETDDDRTPQSDNRRRDILKHTQAGLIGGRIRLNRTMKRTDTMSKHMTKAAKVMSYESEASYTCVSVEEDANQECFWFT